MPKPQYSQKFRSSWLQDPQLRDWLQLVSSTSGDLPKCKVCGIILRNHYGDLKSHGKSNRHLQNTKIVCSQPKLPFKTVAEHSVHNKEEEVRLALFTAMHTSINAVNHLGEIFNLHTSNDNQKIQLHRTKCTALIKNVIAPHFIKILKDDLNDEPYSLLIDESTDINVDKYLGLIIIYYSKKNEKIVSTFLDLVELNECNADAITEAVKTTLKKFNLNLTNLSGIGTDNASVMTGINNGVYAKLKQEVPHLVLVRCLCHSLQLAVSSAAKEFLPRNLEFLIRESYDWFARSSVRQSVYKELFRTINDGREPLKIIQSSQTRWLSIEVAVSRIYAQWLELKTHFSIAKLQERCHTAEVLHELYSNETNYAYISFMLPILTEVNRVNKMFESVDIDHTKLFKELSGLLDMLISRIITPGHKIDIFKHNINDYINNKSYLGYRFEVKISEMRGKGLPYIEEQIIRDRCINFIAKLINEIKNRLPENIMLMQQISKISVQEALNHNKEGIIELIKYFNKSPELTEKIDEQWRQIHLLKWTETKKTKEFWTEVLKFQDAQGESRFRELATFANHLLILPHSNADVERLFSSMNLVKSKLRNKMKLPLLCASLRIRWGLRLESKCCNTYPIPQEIIKQIGTKESYQQEIDDSSSEDDI